MGQAGTSERTIMKIIAWMLFTAAHLGMLQAEEYDTVAPKQPSESTRAAAEKINAEGIENFARIHAGLFRGAQPTKNRI